MQCWPLRSEPTTALPLSFASLCKAPLSSIQSADHGRRGVVAHLVIMPPTFTLMPIFLLGLTLAPAGASDGFMTDFFAKFPNLPFANVHSLEAHLGELPHRETLLEDGQVKRQVMKVKKLFYKSKVLPEKSEDGDLDGKIRIKSKVISGPTPKSKKKGKKLLFKSRLLPSPSTPLPNVRPGKAGSGTNYPVSSDQDYFDRFGLANPVHFQQQQRSPITTNLPNEFSTMDSKVSKKRFHKLKSNFSYYADEYGSRHFGPVSEDFFATQIVRPRVTAEKGFSAFDPFTHSPRKRRKYGHKDHFYYEETKKIKSDKEHKKTSHEHKKVSHEHKKSSTFSLTRKKIPSKVLYRKPKVGIVIKEKAVSGEVQNPSTSSTSPVHAASENELTTTVPPGRAELKSLPFLEVEEEGIVSEEERATPAPPVTETTPSTTTASTSPTSVPASKSTTKKTTTLPSSSVSSLPPLAKISHTSTLSLRYRITPSPSPHPPFHNTYLGAPHQQPFDFNTFMTVPRYLPRLPDIPRHHTVEAPKHTKSFTKYLTRSTARPSPPPSSRPTSILPPYTPSSSISTPAPRPLYGQEEFLYSNEELDEEVKTYDSNFDLLKVRPRSPPKSTSLKTTKAYKYRVLPSITLTSSPPPPLYGSSSPPPPSPSPTIPYPPIPTYVHSLRPQLHRPYIPSRAGPPHPADNLHIYKDPYDLPPPPPPYLPYQSKPPHPADSLHIFKNREEALAALYPPPRPVYLDRPSSYLPPLLPAPPATAGYIPPAPLTHYNPPSTPSTLLKNGKYKSKIHYKPKGETSRKDFDINDDIDSVPKEMPRNMIIKGDFFETIGDPDVRLRELTSESIKDRDFEQEYTKTRVAVNESIFNEEERIESISNQISLEETLERPSTNSIETTVETLGASPDRPKRKTAMPWPTKESFKRKFKPSDRTYNSPRENGFLSDTFIDKAEKRFSEDDQGSERVVSEQISVSQQLEKLMSKAIFQPPTFLTGFTPSPRYKSSAKKLLPSKSSPPLPSSALPPTNDILSSSAPAKEKKLFQHQKKKLYNYEVERPRYEGNPKRIFLKPVRLDPESMLKIILDKYRGKKNYALQQRHSLPTPKKKNKPLLRGYTTPLPYFPPAAKPLQRLPKSLFSDTGKDVTSTPPSSQDTYRKFLNKIKPSRISVSSSSSSSSSSDLETVLERPSR